MHPPRRRATTRTHRFPSAWADLHDHPTAILRDGIDDHRPQMRQQHLKITLRSSFATPPTAYRRHAQYLTDHASCARAKVREGQVANRPVYATIGVTVDGHKDVLGLWMGSGGEGAKFWMSVLIDLKNRGIRDVFFLVCDGLKGLPEVVATVWPQTIVQTCIVYLIRNTIRLTSRKDWDALKRDVKPIYTAPNPDAALVALDELAEKWGTKYGAMIRLWRNAWNEFVPFLDYDVEIRQMICSTNAIESLNARYRRAVRARGHFPTEQAAMKCLYLVTRSLDPTGAGRARWTMRWKPVLNAFAITFSDRWPVAETY
jgi:putative transposase